MVSDELIKCMTTGFVLKAVHSNLSCRIGPEAAASDRALTALDEMIGDVEEKTIAMMANELGLEPAIQLPMLPE